jgi:two-component system, chemotaxis family, sensor kinase CheA
MTDAEIDKDALVRLFFEESEEGLAAMEQALVTLEQRPGDGDALKTAFRVAHTLKGNAASLGFAEPAALGRARSEPAGDGPAAGRRRHAARDAGRGPRVSAARAELRARLRALGAAAPAPAGRAPLERPSAALEHEEGPARPDGSTTGARTLRVSLETLDRILDLTGEIAVDRGRLREALERGGEGAQDAAEMHRESERLHAELQELVMKARMEPLEATFRRFVRTVRDLAASLGKSARLVIEGEDVEVDAKVIEHVRDPLTHLVRNALSHGIEAPAERDARGKDRCGLLRLRAFREAGGIVIEVADDGAGLASARIAERARAMGLAADPASLPEPELQRLIFAPGFSTAAAVTELSGRGVGLDVVQRNIDALRGSVSVASREGHGTTFTIRLPLSLAIVPGFAVQAAGETFILPLDGVHECLELPKGELRGPDGSGVLSLRGEALACRRLRQQFELPDEPPAREYVVVVAHGGRRLGLVVDELLGENQAVLKPLGRLFRSVAGLAGSAILGSGRVALMLDMPGLFREALK